MSQLPNKFQIGIGHTRWATHGKPSEQNAHPFESDSFVLLHNGIIENFKELKDDLIHSGYIFNSETDSEVAVHFLDHSFKNQDKSLNPIERVRNSILNLVKKIRGTFAFIVICKEINDTIFAVKYSSPLVIGVGKAEKFITSGINAALAHTKEFLVLEDCDIAIIKANDLEIINFNSIKQVRKVIHIDWSPEQLNKNGFEHFMLKEIYETPLAVSQCLTDRIDRVTGKISESFLSDKFNFNTIDRIQILACGTSYYAAQIARFYFEEINKIPVEVEIASESRYREPTTNKNTFSIAVSQSGETADTLQAIKNSKETGAQTLALVNVPGSSIGHVCLGEVLLKAGPEVGVASTKAFSAQICTLILISIYIAQYKNTLSTEYKLNLVDNLFKAPSYQDSILNMSSKLKETASHFLKNSSVLYIGRGKQWPIAMEGALKLKELSYIHAEGYPAGELKHGPIALIDENMWVICLCPKDRYYEKTLSNIAEIKARKGKILSIGTDGDKNLEEMSDLFISIPDVPEAIQPFMTSIPLHLFAYWVSVLKGNDVDQPRNLAKSVTVE